MGLFLEKAFDIGAGRIFKEISMRAVSKFGLDCRHVHFDTTSRNVYGDYEPRMGTIHSRSLMVTAKITDLI